MRAAEDGRNDETMLPQETSAEQACVQRVHDCHVVETGTTLTARCSRRQVLPLGPELSEHLVPRYRSEAASDLEGKLL